MIDLNVLETPVASTDAQHLLERSEQRYRSLVNNVPGAVYRCRFDGAWRMCFVSEGIRAIAGVRPEALMGIEGEPFADFIHPEDRAAVRAAGTRAVATGENLQISYRVMHADGSQRWVQDNAHLLRDEHGAVTFLDGLLLDVHERRAAQEACLASQQFAQGVVDGLTQHIAILDERGTIVAVNEAWRRFARENGGDVERLSEGANYLEVCRAAAMDGCHDARRISLGIEQVMQGHRELFEHEYGCHAPKRPRWFNARVTRFFPEPGKLRIVVTHHNSTRNRLAHHAVVRSQQRLHQQNQALSDLARLSRQHADDLHELQRATLKIVSRALRVRRVGLWMLEDHGQTLRRTQLHATACRTAATDAAVMVIHRSEHRAYFEAMEQDQPLVFDDPRNDARTASMTAGYLEPLGVTAMLDTPLQVEGRTVGVMCVEHVGPARAWSLDEINFAYTASNQLSLALEAERRRRAEQALTASNEELSAARAAAERANEAKSQFLANVSHEIRTPMTAITGYVDLLERGQITGEKRAEALGVVRRNAEHLLQLIDDVLDLSKSDAGRMTVERIPCSPRRIAEDVVALLEPRAKEKGLELTVERVGAIPRTVETDPTRLRQVLINLVGNAVKFTQAGRIQVVLDRAADSKPRDGGESHARLRIRVVDTGIGMSGEQMEQIFEPFMQADASTTRRFGGTGLGLAIAQRLARLMGEQLTVCSQEGEGTTFAMLLDAGPVSAVELEDGAEPARMAGSADDLPEKAQPSLPSLAAARVLLAEDGPDNQVLLRFILEEAGAAVSVVADGEAAVAEAMGAAANKRPFDVVLMDMQMPGCDGYEATSRLREAGYEGVILALTAHASADDRTRCLAVGCDEYLTKPIDQPTLLGAVADRLALLR